MIIEDLLVWADRRSFATAPESDPLFEADALLDAALVDIRVDATTLTAWLLFDCRGAVEIQQGNTAVVAVHGVTGLHWDSEWRAQRMWRSVMGWSPEIKAGRLSLTADLSPGGRLQVEGVAGEFFVGDIPGGDEPPPDFTSATDREIRAGLGRWTSEFRVVYASFREV